MTRNGNTLKNYWIYVLLLENANYYIGITTNPSRRVKQHFLGYGAEWTKQYKPDIIYSMQFIGLTTIDKARELERNETIKYMIHFDINKVRGAGYTHTRNYKSVSFQQSRD